jgi:ABC-type transport system substrate-binding protein
VELSAGHPEHPLSRSTPEPAWLTLAPAGLRHLGRPCVAGLATASRRRARRLVALLLAVSAVLAGCTAPDLEAPLVPSQPTVPGGYLLDTEGTVTVGVPSLPTNFNPSTPAGDNRVTQMVMEQVWPQPFVTDPGFNTEISSLLDRAEVVGIDPFKVVYVIDPAAVWSDGVPITAADFAYAWREHLLHSAGLPSSGLVAGYRDITSVVGSHGGTTVTVTFREPFAEWQELFADLVPAKVAQRYGWSRAFQGFSPSRVISGGPFEVTSYVPGRSLVLSRNPRYWGTPAHVAHIRFLVEKTPHDLLAALYDGEVQVGELPADEYPPGTFGNGRIGAPTVLGGSGGLAGSSGPGGGADLLPYHPAPSALSWSAFEGSEIWQLCFNLADPLTGQLALRRGILYALDRSEIVADSEDLIDPRVGVSLSRFTLSGETANPSSPGTSPIVERDPILAKPAVALAYLRQAGYVPGAGGLVRESGTGAPLVMELLEPSHDWAVDEAGLVIQAQLRAIGVTLHLVRRTLDRMLTVSLPEGRFQLALAPYAVSTAVAAVAPEYSAPVLPGVVTPVPGSTTGSGASGTGLAGDGTSGTAGSGVGGAVSPLDWTTVSPPGTEPGASAANAVTRDVLGLDDPILDRRLSAELTELNPPLALTDLQRADSRMWNEAYTVPLFQPGEYLVRSGRVDNVSESPTWAGVMWDAEDWAILKHAPASSGSSTPSSVAGSPSSPGGG